MIILAAAAALTVLQGEAAYIAGRCAMHQTPRAQAEAAIMFSALPPPMLRMYAIGMKESESEPLSREVCKRAIDSVNADIEATNAKTNQSYSARDNDKR